LSWSSGAGLGERFREGEVKVYAACIDCEWRGASHKSGLSAKGAVRDGEAHHVATGHAVTVPTFTGGQRVLTATEQPASTTPAPGFAPADLRELFEREH
jgi:hypothetical protein